MTDEVKEQIKELVSQVAASADAGTVAKDYGSQGLSLVMRRIYYLLDHSE